MCRGPGTGDCVQRDLSPTSGYTGISARRRYAIFFNLQSVPTRSLSTLVLLLLLLIISVTHSTCGVLCTVVGGVCAAASTILAVAIAKFRSLDKNRDKKQHA